VVEDHVLTWGDLGGMRSQQCDSAPVRDGRCDRREVSSLSAVALAKEGGRNNMVKNREDERSLMNDDTRQRDHMKDRTNTGNRPAHPSTTTKPQGEVRHGYGTQAEQESSRGIQLEDILNSENLGDAWKQVRANKGAAGVDGMEVGEFPDFYAKHWETIRRKLMKGSYSPSPVRRVEIPKGKGQTRSLGIPTVRVHY
jgi:hypothetical protein